MQNYNIITPYTFGGKLVTTEKTNAEFHPRPRSEESAGQKEKGKVAASYGGAVVGETKTEEREQRRSSMHASVFSSYLLEVFF